MCVLNLCIPFPSPVQSSTVQQSPDETSIGRATLVPWLIFAKWIYSIPDLALTFAHEPYLAKFAKCVPDRAQDSCGSVCVCVTGRELGKCWNNFGPLANQLVPPTLRDHGSNAQIVVPVPMEVAK